MHIVPFKIDQTKKMMKWYHDIQTSYPLMMPKSSVESLIQSEVLDDLVGPAK